MEFTVIMPWVVIAMKYNYNPKAKWLLCLMTIGNIEVLTEHNITFDGTIKIRILTIHLTAT